MRVSFDSGIKLAGIGLVPWTRLGLERWLPNYAIASLYDWDMGDITSMPKVHALSNQVLSLPHLTKLNVAHLLKEPSFQSLLDKLPEYDFLTYKPVRIPEALAHRKFLMTDLSLAERFENKVLFREMLGDDDLFPAYRIVLRSDLQKDKNSFAELLAGREGIVIQDEQLSGGRGTAIVRNFEQYCTAIDNLARLSQHERVVISELITGAKERSIQGVVTKFGVYTGPLQRQIVAHPLLTNTQIADGGKYCGAQILSIDQNTPLHRSASTIVQKIGALMQAQGFSGIFGVDFVANGDKLFVLEVNPRITGVTPLLTRLYSTEEYIPFYLLHVLELGKYNYKIVEPTISPAGADGAMLVLRSQSDKRIKITHMPQSGTYTLRGGELVQIERSINPYELVEDQFIIEAYMPSAMSTKPAGRLATLYFKGAIMDKGTDQLYNSVNTIVRRVYQNILTEIVR